MWVSELRSLRVNRAREVPPSAMFTTPPFHAKNASAIVRRSVAL
jgi:hypothetical protein